MLTPQAPPAHPAQTKIIPDVVREQLAIETNMVEEVPSGFKPYGKTVEITYDTYSLLEIKKLSLNIPLWQKYLIMLDGIHSKDIDVADLTFNDFEFINVYRKMAVPGINDYVVPFTCPEHGSQKHKFNTGAIGFDSLEIELPLVKTFSTGVELTFNPLTVGSVIRLLKDDMYFIKHRDTYLLDNKQNKLLDEIAVWATQTTLPYAEAYKIISELPEDADAVILDEVDAALDHGMVPLECVCKARIGEFSEEYLKELEAQEQYKKDVINKKAQPGKKLKNLGLYDDRPMCNNTVFVRLQGGGSFISPFRGDLLHT